MCTRIGQLWQVFCVPVSVDIVKIIPQGPTEWLISHNVGPRYFDSYSNSFFKMDRIKIQFQPVLPHGLTTQFLKRTERLNLINIITL